LQHTPEFSLSEVVLSPNLTNSNGHASLIDLALHCKKWFVVLSRGFVKSALHVAVTVCYN